MYMAALGGSASAHADDHSPGGRRAKINSQDCQLGPMSAARTTDETLPELWHPMSVTLI
jgi:hypothetical protein